MASSARRAQLGLGAVCVMFILTLGIMAAKSAEARREAGSAAPDFKLKDVEGKDLSLASLRGRTVVLFFGSTRSGTSGDYLDRFVNFARRYAHDQRVQVLCVETPVRGQEPCTAEELRVYRNVIGQPCPTLADADGKLASLYGVSVLPTVCVVDGTGHVRYRGAFDDNRLAAEVRNHYVEDAVASLLDGRPLSRFSTQPFGCPIAQSK